jgi:hypothetical protein
MKLLTFNTALLRYLIPCRLGSRVFVIIFARSGCGDDLANIRG